MGSPAAAALARLSRSAGPGRNADELARVMAACMCSAAFRAAAACAACSWAWRSSVTARVSVYQVRYQSPGQDCAATADITRQCQEPRGGAQTVSVPRAAWTPSIWRAGCAVVGIRRALQRRVTERPCRYTEGGGRRPGSVGRHVRVGTGAAADVLRGRSSLPRRMPEEHVAFRGGEPERPGALSGAVPDLVPAAAQLRQGQFSGQPPASVPTGCTVFGHVTGERHRVPGDLARIDLAEPHPHQHARLAQLERRTRHRPARVPPPR